MFKEISLSQFILGREFGDFLVGESIKHVRKKLPNPEDIGKGNGKTTIEKYYEGNIQIGLHGDEILYIAIYLDRGDFLKLINESILLWDLPGNITTNMNEFIGWLKGQQAVFKFRDAGAGNIAIDVMGGSSVGFDSGKLVTIQTQTRY